MTAAISTIYPPAGAQTPPAEVQEKALAVLKQELSACGEKALSALLLHEMARIHERREDLAGAARDELAATKQAAGFVEPIETLIGIATRSHSHSNLIKLTERLLKLATTEEERLRAHVALVTLFCESGDPQRALAQVDAALESAPSDPTLWLALETVAAQLGDRPLRRRAVEGRAAHVRSPDLRALLLERAARLAQTDGEHELALDFVRQSVDERPTWRALHAWELFAVRQQNYDEAARAALQTGSIIRATLSEPDEASLYDIPQPELTQERAFGAQFRALVYASQQQNWELARSRAEELVEMWPEQPFAWASTLELARRITDRELHSRCLRALLDASTESDERAYLAASLLLTGADEATRELSVQTLLDAAPECQAARTLRLTARLDQASRHGSEGDSREQITALSEALSEAWNDSLGSDRDELSASLARSLLYLATGRTEQALALLSSGPQATESKDGFRAALREGALQSHATLTNQSRTYPVSLSCDAEDRVGLEWAELRTRFVTQGSLSKEQVESTSCLDQLPFVRLLFHVLRAPKSAPAAISRYLEYAPPPERAHALLALGALLEEPGAESAQPHIPTDPKPAIDAGAARLEHPLVVGLQVRREDVCGSFGAFLELARAVDDPEVRGAWLLRALFLALEGRDWRKAEQALSALQEHDPKLARAPANWLAAISLSDAPLEALSYFEQRALSALGHPGDSEPALDPAFDRRTDYFFLLHRLRRSELLGVARSAAQDTALNSAQQALILLAASSESAGLAYVRETISLSPIVSDETDQVLHLALPGVHADWCYLVGLLSCSDQGDVQDVTQHLLAWVAACRQGEPRTEAEAVWRLGEALDDVLLLTLADVGQLTPTQAQRRRHRLLERHHAGESTDDPDQVSHAQMHQAVAWSLCEEANESEQSEALWRLAQSIDPALQDADAQLALLCAGYRCLKDGDFERAITDFEPLLEVLPSDLTLCQGIRIAARHTERFDLEARVTRELARHAADNRSSAQLWERAGLLYQDHLHDPVQAEECFSAALAQHPGSPLSFERLYRFARAKKDRTRQVDLLEARLATADSETLVVELLWEKARLCRMLGRRDESLGAVTELRHLAPDHLPSVALAAELFLAQGDKEQAADALRDVALHPDTPAEQRVVSGFVASDLFDRLGESRLSLGLLHAMESMGITSNEWLFRKARSLAKVGDYGAAFDAFLTLNDRQDRIDERRETARLLLALQRDQLRDPEMLKEAVRRVLRDDPLNRDALDVALGLADANLPMISFEVEERRRLFARAREQTVQALRAEPLSAEGVRLLSRLCHECGNRALERVAWGLLSLTHSIEDGQLGRLRALQRECPVLPNHTLYDGDLDAICARGQLGAMGRYAAILAPFAAQALEPSLEALGVSPLMSVSDASHPMRRQVNALGAAFGLTDFELFVGGFHSEMIRGLNRARPTLVIGGDVELPLSRRHVARLAAQMQALRLGTCVFLNQPYETMQAWCEASQLVASGTSSEGRNEAVSELGRTLGHTLDRATREALAELLSELGRARFELTQLPAAALLGAARAAAVAYGDPSFLREMPELLPTDEQLRDTLLSEVVRFCLSEPFIAIRKRAGLEAG